MLRYIGLAIALVACTTDAPPPGYGSDLGTTESPVPSPDPYVVRSRIQVPLGVPGVTKAIANLQAFAQHGGATLLSVSPTATLSS
ncbi:MAG TPA: hypothetical protein VGC41_17155, partial [Kofleriaceae bacterium]